MKAISPFSFNLQNLPNILTVFRLLIIPVVVVLLLFDKFWADASACFFIAIAGISDYFDGLLARKYHLETKLGKFLDPLADKLLVMSALIMLVPLHRVSAVLVVIIIGREILITGLRAIAGSEGIMIHVTEKGKYKTWFQMFAAAFLAYHHNIWIFNIHLIGTIFLWTSIVYSLISATEYLKEFAKKCL